MSICDLENCKCKTSVIGLCRYCHLNFCNKHRLQEIHNCTQLDTSRLYARDNLSKQLNESKILSKKIIHI